PSTIQRREWQCIGWRISVQLGALTDPDSGTGQFLKICRSKYGFSEVQLFTGNDLHDGNGMKKVIGSMLAVMKKAGGEPDRLIEEAIAAATAAPSSPSNDTPRMPKDDDDDGTRRIRTRDTEPEAEVEPEPEPDD